MSPINYCTDSNGNPVTTDQRGVTRPQGTACDIGAFELIQTLQSEAWGYNNDGELGNGMTTDSDIPVHVNTLSALTAIAGGDYHSLALRSDGTVWTWGENAYGELGNDTLSGSDTPVQVLGPGGSGHLTGIVAIAGIGFHSLALRSDGTVWAWGDNGYGQLGNGTTTNSETPVQVVGPGGSGYLTGIVAIAGGLYHSLALRSDGTVWTWGYNYYGAPTNSETPVQVVGPGGSGFLTGIVAVAGGSTDSLALRNDGTVWAWGYNEYGELGNGTFTTSGTPVQVVGPGGSGYLTGIVAIAGGSVHSLAVRSDGTVWAWGYNEYGQLGNGALTTSDTPVQVLGPGGSGYLTGMVAVAGAVYHSLALRSDGTVWAWGNNAYGELGNGTFAESETPVQVSGLSGVVAIAGGDYHSLALAPPGATKLAQTISFTQAAPGTASYNSTFPVAAQSTSGLTVTLSMDSGSTSVCSLGTPSVAGGMTSATVTMLSGAGTCTIFAIQSGNAGYNAAAPQQTSAAAQESGETISFTQPAPATASYYSAFPVAAQSTSGLTVVLSVDAGSTSVCSLGTPSVSSGVTSAIVAMQRATGVCTIDANQSGNGNYTAAAQQQTSATATAATIGGTLTVTNTNDSGFGSLRDAIANAVSGDTINFSVTGTITLASTLTINTSLTITGAGAPNVAISGNNSVQAFSISGGTTVTISGLTIQNGNNTGGGTYGSVAGGGIYNAGTLTLSNSTVSGNTVSATGSGYYVSVYGGGIYNAGTLALSNSTISGNTANGGGNDYYGGVTGGGIFNAGTLTLSNSTISGNTATSANDFYGSVSGGGISNGGTLTVKNSIVANNPSGGNCAGTITSQGYNLSDDASCTSSFTQTGDLNSTAAGLDPSGLKANGGPTQTIALLATSPAVDAIPLSPINYCTDTSGNPITTDQRGVTRPQGSACDIGAFELNQAQAGQTSQTISFTQAAPGTASYLSAFPVAAQSTSGLTVTLSVDSSSTGVCSLGTPSVVSGVTSATVTMLSGTGICTIFAIESGNASYSEATPQRTSAAAQEIGQSISFTQAAPASVSYNSTFPVAAQSTSGLTVALSVDAGSTGVCSVGTPSVASGVTSATVTMLSGTGNCTIDANQAGNSNYSAAAQQQTSAGAALASQATLTVTGPTSVAYGTTGTAIATGGSGTGALTFSVGASTGCSVSGTAVSVTNVAGTCSLTATQAADNNYSATTSNAQTEFVYVTNGGSDNVSAYTIDATSGALTAVAGSPFGAGNGPNAVAVDAGGMFAYVANQNYPAASGTVSAYTINATSGVLTPVAGSPFGEASGEPYGLAVDPTGKFVYAPNVFSYSVSAYAINATSGALTPVVGSPFGTGGNPEGVAVDPTGKFVYVPNSLSDSVSAYTIDATSGALTSVAGSPFGTGTTPQGVTNVAFDPTGKFAYVTNANSNNVSAYTINATSGALTPVAGSPFATGNNPSAVTVSPTGNFAYVTNAGDSNVSAYAINATSGALTQMAGSPFGTGSSPTAVAVDATGNFAYVSNNGSNNVSAYTIDATSGALTPVAGSPFGAGSGPFGMVVAKIVAFPVTLVQASQTITFGALSNQALLGTAPFTLSATASSGLAVSFASTTSAVCTVSGATVTLVAVGTCTIQATQAGNANYAAATPVNQSFQVTQGTGIYAPVNSSTLTGTSATFRGMTTQALPLTGWTWARRRAATSITSRAASPIRRSRRQSIRFRVMAAQCMQPGITC